MKKIVTASLFGLWLLGTVLTAPKDQPSLPREASFPFVQVDCHGPDDCGYADNGWNGDH